MSPHRRVDTLQAIHANELYNGIKGTFSCFSVTKAEVEAHGYETVFFLSQPPAGRFYAELVKGIEELDSIKTSSGQDLSRSILASLLQFISELNGHVYYMTHR